MKEIQIKLKELYKEKPKKNIIKKPSQNLKLVRIQV
jgi:hypothetical protein